MSPLVRSLLALAALLAVADANDPHLYNCVTKIIGQQTSHSRDMYPFPIPYPGEPIYVDPDNENCPGGRPVGEKITVCNNTPQQEAPEIDDPPYGELQPVPIKCHDQAGCTAYITEYCS